MFDFNEIKREYSRVSDKELDDMIKDYRERVSWWSTGNDCSQEDRILRALLELHISRKTKNKDGILNETFTDTL